MAYLIALIWFVWLASESLAPLVPKINGYVLQDLGILALVLGGASQVVAGRRRRAVAWRARLAGPLAFGVMLLGGQVWRAWAASGVASIWTPLYVAFAVVVWGWLVACLDFDARQVLLRCLTGVLAAAAAVSFGFHPLQAGHSPSVLQPTSAWPLANPNHSGVLFASALVLAAGSISHGLVRARRSGEIDWRRWMRDGWLWFDTAVAAVLAAAVVQLGSYSALAVSVVGVVLLILSDHYASLDWISRRALDRLRAHTGWVVMGGLALPLAVVILSAVGGAYQGSVVRVAIWQDGLRTLVANPVDGIFGIGFGDFVEYFARVRSWQLAYPTDVLGPESEAVYWITATGLSGFAWALWMFYCLPWTRLFSRRMGELSQHWQARVALWATVVVAAQAMVDNTLHTLPMLFWLAMLASLSLRTINAQPNS